MLIKSYSRELHELGESIEGVDTYMKKFKDAVLSVKTEGGVAREESDTDQSDDVTRENLPGESDLDCIFNEILFQINKK